MPEAPKCPRCGSPLPSEGWEGLCPSCVVRVSLVAPDTGESGSGNSSSPPAAIAPGKPMGEGAEVQVTQDGKRSSDALEPVSKSQPALGRIRYFGDYELLEEIARGGMGVVYKARQVSLNRLVAVKLILSGEFASEEFVRRFRQEAEAAANLVHPNIVAIHEVGEHEGRHYFSMDYVEGKNLADLVREGPLPAKRAAAYLKTIAEAIHYAHQRGVLHRDLKPSNILVDQSDQPRVTDFGLAKRLASKSEIPNPQPEMELTLTGQVLGSPNFMPPEQAAGRGEALGPPTDVYSLGAILYHLLTARPPFLAETVPDTLRRVVEQEPLSPRLLNPSVSRDLETICLRCLNKEPQRRYATAQELADELGRFQGGKPILARPAGRFEKAWRWCQRNPVVAGLSAAALLIFLAGLTGVVWQWRKTEVALRSAAERATAEAKAKTDANKQRERAEHALIAMQLQRAEDSFAADEPSRGVAQLASVLTSHPSNRVAMERLLSALTLRNFGLPLTQRLRHRDLVLSAQFSPDGLRVVTASGKTAQVWDAQTGKLLTESLRHENAVHAAQFSPDGLRVVTASADNTARLSDAHTGKLLTEPLRHDGIVLSAQFSPNGLRVVTASDDRTARVWDAQTGKPLTEPLTHEKTVYAAQFSPDGLRVVTASFDNTARVWDAQTGKPLTEPLRHEKLVRSAQFSPDGLRVVTASNDGTARLWDAQTGIPLTEPLRHGAHGELVVYAQFSPDGLRVVTTSTDKTARLWDARTGKPLTEPLRHDETVRSAVFSPDGLRVVTASQDKTARVWDAQTGKPLTERLWHRDWVYSAQFSPDGLRVVTASKDNTACVWDVREGKPLTNPLRHPGGVVFAEFSPDGLRLVTTAAGISPPGDSGAQMWDSRAQIWDAQTGKPLTEPFCQEYGIESARFSPEGLRVLTTDGSRTARVWDAQTGTPITGPLRHKERMYTAHFSPDGLRVVTASFDKTARVWDALTGKPLTEPLRHESIVYSAQFSPDGLRVVTASQDKTARVWDAQTGKPLLEPLRHEGPVSFAQFSPDGFRLLTACGKKAHLWDAQTGKPLTEPLQHEDSVRIPHFSLDGLRVVTASADRTARVWDAQTGKPLTEPLRHESAVRSAHFSPDGLRVVTTSDDKTARVWDAQTGKPLTEPLRHEALVWSARFSPDGLRVVTSSRDKTARVWDLTFGPVPVPPWFPQLAEAAAGQRLAGDGVLLPVSAEEFLKLKDQISVAPATNFYIGWAKWFCADRATRTVTPFSPITVPKHITRGIEENSLESLREAVRLAPTNAVALARLAQRVLALSPEEHPRRADEADFLSRRAAELAPGNSEVLTIRAAVSREVDDLRHR